MLLGYCCREKKVLLARFTPKLHRPTPSADPPSKLCVSATGVCVQSWQSAQKGNLSHLGNSGCKSAYQNKSATLSPILESHLKCQSGTLSNPRPCAVLAKSLPRTKWNIISLLGLVQSWLDSKNLMRGKWMITRQTETRAINSWLTP